MPFSNIRTIAVTPTTWKAYARTNGFGRIINTTVSFPYMQTVRPSQDDEQYTFYFPFPPTQITYSDLAPEMSEIARPGKKPLVLFSRRRAHRINLQFLVAKPDDGMFFDIEHGLNTLKGMAESGLPVRFFRVDTFLGATTLDLNEGITISGKQWVIMDLRFDSIRRNARQRITAASVQMSFVEGTFPKLEVYEMAPIEYTVEVQRPPTPGNRPEEPEEEDPPNFPSYIDIDGRSGDVFIWD